MTAVPPRPAPGPAPTLEAPPDLVAAYANLVRIAHSPSELVFDFAQLLPGVPNARVCSRIVMSPTHAKLLYRALGENLSRYESAFGEIHLPGDVTLADYLFRPPQQPPENPPKG
jgi:hypothetical protein